MFYIIYGMYWLINLTTGPKDHPQAVLIRGVEGINGPGKVGKWLEIDYSFYGEDVTKSKRIWITEEKSKYKFKIKRTTRIGVDYAGDWAKKKWRFVLEKT
jgi:DNA-3-methyladenine glycosylase